ncbi:hypothetical protein [Neisseria zoodegmatis]|nr:hypothetical protein [Neisseria zoodegmatis]SNU80597.1 Uncharacterised protein [Neisseria zoodegmatis]
MKKYQKWLGLTLIALLSACAGQQAPVESPLSSSTQSIDTAPQAAAQSMNVSKLSYESAATNRSVRSSERLGTQWGDEVSSYVTQVDLRRTSETPIAETAVRYADKHYRGRGINEISLAAGKIGFFVESDSRRRLPIFRTEGQYFLQGKAGQAYRLVYRNHTDKTYEIVASVDGIDVISGKAASRYHAGYVLKPKGTLVIEGFRKSDSAVASFIFSKPADAYAANTPAGSIANTGIIGTVVYELYDPNRRIGEPQPFPADNGYAPPPR